jgi:hypothetical protein
MTQTITSGPAAATPSDQKQELRQLRRMEWFLGIFAFILIVLSMTLSFMSNTCKQVSDLISEQNAAATRLGVNIDYYTKSPISEDAPPPPGFLHDLVEFSRRNATMIYTSDRMSLPRSIERIFISEELEDRIKNFSSNGWHI